MPELAHAFRSAAYAPATSEDIITLLELSHPAWDGPLRLCDYWKKGDIVTHDGKDYLFAIASVAAPGADPSALPEATFVLNNLDGQYDWLDEADIENVSVEVIEVLKSDPEIVIRPFQHFSLAEVEPGGETLTLTLGLKAVEEERSPAHSISKSRAPALFTG